MHSNLEALEGVVANLKKEGVDNFIFLGDIVGYASNPSECISITRELAYFCVAGNHDWGCAGKFSLDYFNSEAKEAIEWTVPRLNSQELNFLSDLKLVIVTDEFTLVHSTLYRPERFGYIFDSREASFSFSRLKTPLCFLGHTHVPVIFVQDRSNQIYCVRNNHIFIKEDLRYIVNVGSVGQPRDGNPCSSYCIYDTDSKLIQLKRVSYNVALAHRKIIDSGLPSVLADRLLRGY